ncbi:BTAD domain-containing putative transcriptional regulator [Actinoplanes oblitus]|uniref:BTAD domain-containing putative transcriptional regulator n=1 Tax=Actinoplanes oblitus TaxID=3040509 RepID=A0ABY8WKY9_9ACTN|nr:BTAD domain-containing putative transcriptional regulator [Actinoplanes oblitus]WIM97535.1 BTAD domain-containing putative transcriptional regulator [Actinoplanes oblitus]
MRAFRGPDPVDLGPAKQRAVLAVLLLSPGRPVPTHRIVDAVWGDEPPENGANVVQKYVAGLRRALGRESLVLSAGGYTLAVGEGALDADVFRAELARAGTEQRAGRDGAAAEIVRAALTLWHGDALDGLGGPVFEAARTRLADDRAGAWELWADLRLATGDDAGLVGELTRLTHEFPLREGLRERLMLALHRAGRQAEALAVFRDTREFFLDELGAEPGERMQEVHRRILRGELEQPPPPDPVSPPPYRPVSPPPGAPFSPAPFPPATLAPPSGHPRWLEIAAAAAAPFLTCGVAAWVYFLYAAIQRGRWYHYAVAGLYLVALPWIVMWFEIDPSPIDSETTTAAEGVAVMSWLALWLGSTVHGIILAVHGGDTRSARTRREMARRFAALDPAAAAQAGIGRPDLIRYLDDGGLVDLNNAPPEVLARVPGIGPAEAHRIGLDRHYTGPYRQPADLVTRGLLTPRRLRRAASWLICLESST